MLIIKDNNILNNFGSGSSNKTTPKLSEGSLDIYSAKIHDKCKNIPMNKRFELKKHSSRKQMLAESESNTNESVYDLFLKEEIKLKDINLVQVEVSVLT